jgi:hypothetical protein
MVELLPDGDSPEARVWHSSAWRSAHGYLVV